ncbi:hypothetical protein [Rhabdaerophilum sp. SD176]|uniref:hypothetical protein n=1 Tax=Rhabdaerophilum sp. SD176 TaxID=2983548 RepID=UPI0024DF5CC8|nr:hypothetical protein [Rhabdaerophilum sp. SD176]
MPISTMIMLAVLVAMRVLCLAIAALFVMVAIRSLFDADLTIRWWQALVGAGIFLATGLAAGLLRKALARNTR